MKLVVLVVVVLTVSVIGLGIIARWDKPLAMSPGLWGVLFSGALGESVLIHIKLGELPIGSFLALGIFAGCLLLACMTDTALCQVYNFVWWMALVAGSVLWLQRFRLQETGGENVISAMESLVQLLLFALLQLFVFGRTYGRADCYAFCACALVEMVLGMGLEGYLSHMIVAYLLLILVQALRGNISRKGRLKHPVPFLPYITLAFWMTILLLL